MPEMGRELPGKGLRSCPSPLGLEFGGERFRKHPISVPLCPLWLFLLFTVSIWGSSFSHCQAVSGMRWEPGVGQVGVYTWVEALKRMRKGHRAKTTLSLPQSLAHRRLPVSTGSGNGQSNKQRQQETQGGNRSYRSECLGL